MSLIRLKSYDHMKKSAAATVKQKAKQTSLIKLGPSLGEFVRDIRKTQNLTQKQLADLSGTSFNFISQLEGGKTSVRWSHVLQVLHTLGVKIECKWGNVELSL